MVGAYLVPGSAERTAGRAGHLHVWYFSVPSEGVLCLAPPRPVASVSLEKHMESNPVSQLQRSFEIPSHYSWCFGVVILGLSEGRKRSPGPTQMSGEVLVGVHSFDNIY